MGFLSKFPEPWFGSSDDLRPTPQILFSLCQTTARLPDGWRAAAQSWFDNCDHPENVEHVLTWDQGPVQAVAGPLQSEFAGILCIFPNTRISINDGPKTAVAGWNLSAKLSSGKFIISLADDWFAFPHWDTELKKVIEAAGGFDKDIVLDVDTAGNDHLLTFSMLTRSYLMKYSGGEGWLFYPEYTGMYADNDFTDSARLDKVIVNARHLRFEHRHPNYFADVEPDAVHLWQGRPEAFKIGLKVYKKRCAQKGLAIRPIIAVCLPGESFSSTWVAYWTTLMNYLSAKFTVSPIFTFSSNVHVTRALLANQVINSVPLPDYVLWIDDDNLLGVDQFDMLFEDLQRIPEADMVAGWAYCQVDMYDGPNARTSVGMFGENGLKARLTFDELGAGDFDVREIDYSGFPTVLMRGEMLEKVGPNPFAPIIDAKADYGFHSEDLSFCIRAREKGCRIVVDRRVRVPHLKMRDAIPANIPGVKPVIPEDTFAFADRRNRQARELAAKN